MPTLIPIEHDPFALPPLPEGFAVDSGPIPSTAIGSSAQPPLPAGFELDQPPQYNAMPAQPASQGGQLLTGFENSLSAAGQLTTPNIAAHAPNYLGPATFDEEGNVGYKDAAGGFVLTDQNKHVLLTDPADNVPKVYARTPATDEGRLSAFGRILESGIGAPTLPAAGAVALPGVVQAGGRIGVTLPRVIASERPAMHLAGQAISKLPGGGTLHKAIGSSLGELGGAADTAAELAGGAATSAEAGGAARAGFQATFAPKTGTVAQELSNLYGEVDRLVDPAAVSPLNATARTASNITTRRTAAGLADSPAVKLIAPALEREGGLTYAGMKDLRTRVGEMIDTGFLPADISGAELKQIYGALSEDLRFAAQTAGGRQGLAAFEKANQAAATAAQWQEQVAKVLGPVSRSDEGITQTLYRMAQQGAGADIKTLVQARAAVPASAWEQIAANVIGRLGKTRAGEFQPGRFISDYGQLSDAGKRVLFHGVGADNLIPFLDDIATVSNKFVQAGKLANFSNTASHGALYAAGGHVATKVAEGSFLEPLSVIGAAIGNSALARLLASPATAASTAKWARTYDALINRPGPRTLATFNMATRNLASTGAPAIGWQGSIADLSQRIQGAVQPAQAESAPTHEPIPTEPYYGSAP
jgi:hypothetical protein